MHYGNLKKEWDDRQTINMCWLSWHPCPSQPMDETLISMHGCILAHFSSMTTAKSIV